MNRFNTRGEWLVFVRTTMTEMTARAMSEHLGLTRSLYRYYEIGHTQTPDRVVEAVKAAFPDAPPAPERGTRKPHVRREKIDQPKGRAVFRLMVETYPDDAIPKAVILRWLGAL
jgi:hypothetical protein